MGLIQRIQYELDRDGSLAKEFRSNGQEHGARRLFNHINPLQHQALKECAPGLQGEQAQRAAGLFVGYAKGMPFILEVTAGGGRQFHTVPYAAIGSGDIFASHAICSVAHHDVKLLPMDVAKALAYRTIENAIRTAAWGIGGEVQLPTVTQDGAHCLTAAEIEPVRDIVGIWKEKVRISEQREHEDRTIVNAQIGAS